MAQLISLTTLSENNVTRTGTYLFNVNRMTDIYEEGAGYCRFQLYNTYFDSRQWVVDHTYAAVIALATNYIAGTRIPLYIVSKDGISVGANHDIALDGIARAWADPKNSAQSVIEFYTEDNKKVLYITNITLAALAIAAAGVGTNDLYRGVINCGANPNYPAGTKDWYWYVSVAGLIGGGAGTAVEAGDMVICRVSNAGGTQAAVGADFMIVQRNMIPATAAVFQAGTNNTDFLTTLTLANVGITATATITKIVNTTATLNAATIKVSDAAGTGDALIQQPNENQQLKIETIDSAAAPSGSIIVETGDGFGANQSGNMTIATGSGGATSSTGYATIYTGNAATGTSGSIDIYSGDSTVLGNSGQVQIMSGGTTTGTSGITAIKTGDVATLGTSGKITVQTGASTTSGGSGLVEIKTGATVDTSSGAINIQTGNVSFDTSPGIITLQTGNGGSTPGGTSPGGDIHIYNGNATSNANDGGQTRIVAGNGFGTGLGGSINLITGDGGATGVGGGLNITSGNGGATSGNAGTIAISGGTAVIGNGGAINILSGLGGSTSGNGGNVAITGAAAATLGNGGGIRINAGAGAGVGGANGKVEIGNIGSTSEVIVTPVTRFSDAVWHDKYYWKEDFDEEAAGVTLAAGLRGDEWVIGGTNDAAANTTYIAGVGGKIQTVTAGANNDSQHYTGLLTRFNTSNNPIFEGRFMITAITTSTTYVGVTTAGTDDVVPGDAAYAIANNSLYLFVDSLNVHTFGANHIVVLSKNAAGAIEVFDTGKVCTPGTYVTYRFDLNDPAQPLVYVNVTGTPIVDGDLCAITFVRGLDAATYIAPIMGVQAQDAVVRTITVDYFKAWSDRV